MSAMTEPGQAPVAARDHALDAARGILMIMGILLHTGNIYAPRAHWLVDDTVEHPFFAVLVEWIHFFRMPAFFWISGYFCALTFRKRGAGGLLQQRLPRLFIPLLSSWLLICSLQAWMLAAHDGRPVWDALRSGFPLYHLWFLVDLVVFVCLAAVLMPLLRGRGQVLARADGLGLPGILVGLALLSVLCNLAARATGLAYQPILNLTSLGSLSTYGPFFVAGVLMYEQGAIRSRFLQAPVWWLIAAPLAGWWLTQLSADSPRWQAEALLAVRHLMVWAAVAATLRLFYDLFRAESPVTRFLSDSAYTIYLFHHPFVTGLGLLLLPVALSAGSKFVLVVLGSLVLSTTVHLLVIRHSAAARLMFNGKV